MTQKTGITLVKPLPSKKKSIESNLQIIWTTSCKRGCKATGLIPLLLRQRLQVFKTPNLSISNGQIMLCESQEGGEKTGRLIMDFLLNQLIFIYPT